jgi:hypothetical protein
MINSLSTSSTRNGLAQFKWSVGGVTRQNGTLRFKSEGETFEMAFAA